jgi:hydrogenase/urease accessory protein HupE
MSLDALAAGFLHPLLVPAHALALLAVALLIGQQHSRRLPSAAFMLALAGGLAALTLGVAPTSALDVLFLATAVSGLLVALACRLPSAMVAVLAAIVGAALALDSPPQVISLTAATLTLIGTGIGACLLLALIVTATATLRRGWQRIGVRILGSWVAASAVLVLALRYARDMLF